MKQAGTSPDYRGLFVSVEKFVTPSPEELDRAASDLPERAKVPAFVETMVQVDQGWDPLKAIREAGFKAPPNEPDLDPPHEALQLAEHFRELLRLDETKAKGDDFRRQMETAERNAIALKDALKKLSDENTAPTRRQGEEAFAAAGKSCTGCHVRYRDKSPHPFSAPLSVPASRLNFAGTRRPVHVRARRKMRAGKGCPFPAGITLVKFVIPNEVTRGPLSVREEERDDKASRFHAD